MHNHNQSSLHTNSTKNEKTNSGLKLFKGKVTHTRTSPTLHKFKYSFFQIWLDVEQTDLIDKISRFWSSEKNNLVCFKRENYQPNKTGENNSIRQQVCKKINSQTNKNFDGNVYLLASLSYWGYCYNPVSFYLCYDRKNNLEFILSEIHNTPWGERFTYVHDVSLNEYSHSQFKNIRSDTLAFKFDKAFHVSPFMPMDLNYDWHFQIKQNKVLISMNLQQGDQPIFNATLDLKGQELTKKQANQLPFRYPFMCIKVLLAIYWNALRLWVKGVNFFDHPNS